MSAPRGRGARGLAAALGLAASVVLAWQAAADNSLVAFPETYADGVHYGTVMRGGIREELYTSPEAIAAARQGAPFPDGTVITMEDHRDGALHRYVVMEKRAGWNALSAPGTAAGDWLFREFAPDGTPMLAEDGTRCMSCHQSQAGQDFVFTVREMREGAQ